MAVPPVGLHDLQPRLPAPAAEHGRQLVRGTSSVRRLDERLNGAGRSVVGAHVAPRFEVVRLRQMPVAPHGGFVLVQTEMNARADPVERLREVEIGRGGIDRIGPHHDEQVHVAARHVANQFAKRPGLVLRRRRHGFNIRHRAARVVEGLVDRVRQRVDDRRLAVTGNHQAGSAMLFQILNDGVEPSRRLLLRFDAGFDAQRRRQLSREEFDGRRRERQAVIGRRAGDRWNRFYRVQPVHGLEPGRYPPPRREVAGVAHAARPPAENVGVERNHHVRLGEVVDAFNVLAERPLRALQGVVPPNRLIRMPARQGKERKQVSELRRERRRRDGSGQDPEAGALRCPVLFQLSHHGRRKRVPAARAAEVLHDLRAVRIVEIENRRLREAVGSAQAGGMLGIALHFDRPAHVALRQQAEAVAAKRHGGGVEQRPARNHFLGRLHIGHDLLGRLPRAGGQARQGKGRAHQPEEVAAGDRVPLGCGEIELAARGRGVHGPGRPLLAAAPQCAIHMVYR